jgi:hypothetical protein
VKHQPRNFPRRTAVKPPRLRHSIVGRYLAIGRRSRSRGSSHEEARADPWCRIRRVGARDQALLFLADQIHLTLIDKSDSFVFGFSKLDIMLGRRSIDEVSLHYKDIAKHAVDFRQERVTSIDPGKRRV